jgi:putative phosphoesterase
MFRLGVVSDSHGSLSAVERAGPLLMGLDAIAHLGDGVEDAKLLSEMAGLPLYAVAGNCDLLPRVPAERIETFSGVRTLLTHANRYHVKRSLFRLSLRAREAGAALALFGHTHEPTVEWEGGVLLVNPGSLQNGRYAIIEFRENGPTPFLLRFE